VFLRPGAGGITVNDKPLEKAFPTEALRTQIKQPLAVTETGDKFDVLATIAGGGTAGARRAHQGTQEVRTEGRAEALPIQ
jgi:small subunit ribosomal protein S9